MLFDLDKAIASWRRPFEYNPRFLKEDVDELDQHIRDQVGRLILAGKTEKEAFDQTMIDMGSLGVMEDEYQKVFWGKIKRKGAFFRTFLLEINMWTSYFRLAWRNLMKNKLASLINIAGLSTAIGCCIVAFLFTDLFYNRDTFHTNGEHIFITRYTVNAGNDEIERWGDSPIPLGPALEADFPQVERAVRLASGSGYVRYEDKVFEENIRFVDAGFLDMFTFPLKYGDSHALSDNNAVVLSDELAEKYFGLDDPTGAQINIRFTDTTMVSFLVQGVTEKLPDKASFGFDLLIPFDNMRSLGHLDTEDWSQLITATFVQLNDPASITALASGMDRYLAQQNAASTERPILQFEFEPLLTMAQTAHSVRNRLSFLATNPGQVIYTLVTGLFLLFLSCFNYINIAITSVARRLKEIGIRKVVGGTRAQLIAQFLCENLFLCLLAMALGVLLGDAIFAPGFNKLFGVFHLHLEYTSRVT